jgi:hypothetical protein
LNERLKGRKDEEEDISGYVTTLKKPNTGS